MVILVTDFICEDIVDVISFLALQMKGEYIRLWWKKALDVHDRVWDDQTTSCWQQIDGA